MTDEHNSASDLPTAVRTELARLRAERAVLLAEREGLLQQLNAAKAKAKAGVSPAGKSPTSESAASAGLRERSTEHFQSQYEVDKMRRERNLAQEELRRTRGERDQLRLEMLNAELIAQGYVIEGDGDQIDALRAELARVSADALALRAELDAHRATVSWRVTKPLRAARRRQLGR